MSMEYYIILSTCMYIYNIYIYYLFQYFSVLTVETYGNSWNSCDTISSVESKLAMSNASGRDDVSIKHVMKPIHCLVVMFGCYWYPTSQYHFIPKSLKNPSSRWCTYDFRQNQAPKLATAVRGLVGPLPAGPCTVGITTVAELLDLWGYKMEVR